MAAAHTSELWDGGFSFLAVPPNVSILHFFLVFIVQCCNRVIVEGAHQALPTHLKCVAALERQTFYP
jgi:hypothetical protein